MRLKTRHLIPLLLASVSVSPHAHAQSANESAARNTIVVTGERLNKDEARSVARAYLRGIVALPVSGQYARWKVAVCPHVIGLSDRNAELVAENVREIARAAGARVGRSGCAANLDIVFTDDGEAQMRAITRRSSRMLQEMTPTERDALLHGPQPVRWWYVTKSEGTSGYQAGGESAALLGASIEGGGPGFISNGNGKYIDGYTSTLIGTGVRSHFDSVAVLVDLNKATGKTLGSVAAYVAMVALAQIKMDGTKAVGDSILRLFDTPDITQGGLSRRDRAFLKALYSTPTDRERQQQSAAIVAIMMRMMAQD